MRRWRGHSRVGGCGEQGLMQFVPSSGDWGLQISAAEHYLLPLPPCHLSLGTVADNRPLAVAC
jgi:hypothetical protein